MRPVLLSQRGRCSGMRSVPPRGSGGLNMMINFVIRIICLSLFFVPVSLAEKPDSPIVRGHATMTSETKALVDNAIGIVCTQAKLDPQSSIAIDDMPARPSLPLQSPEEQTGAEPALKRTQ